MRGEQAIFYLKIKKKSGLSINPDIHYSKVFSSVLLILSTEEWRNIDLKINHRKGFFIVQQTSE